MKRGIVLLCTVAALCACSKNEPTTSRDEVASGKQSSKVTSSRPVNLHVGSEPAYIDANLVSEDAGFDVALALYDGLVEYGMKGSDKPTLSMAESYAVDKKTGTVYTFKLRKDLKWSDGVPITAQDFVYSWRRALDPQLASEYAFALYYVKNAQAYNTGQITDPSIVGVSAPDDHTLIVQLEGPTPFFLDLLAYPTFRPVPRHVIEKHGNQWTRPGNMVSSGPFVLKAHAANQKYTLVKNPHFWDAATVKAPGVNFHIVENLDTAIRMYMAGDLDKVKKLPTKQIPRLRDHEGYVNDSLLSVYFYQINTEQPPFDNVKVRQALAHAIDRKTLSEKYLLGVHFPWANMVARGLADYTYAPARTFDPSKAQQLLAEAGYPEGKGFPEATISYNTNEDHKLIASVVQQMWKEHLGVHVTLQNEEWKSLLKTYQTQQYDIGRFGWGGDYPDPNTFLEIWLTESTANNTGWSNARFDALLAQAAQERDAAKRLVLLSEAEAIMLHEVPAIPIYAYGNPTLLRSSVKNYHPTLKDAHPMRAVYIEE